MWPTRTSCDMLYNTSAELSQGERYHEEDTLILTAISSNPDQSTPEMSDHKSREVFFATVLTKLRKRGISLRHQVWLLLLTIFFYKNTIQFYWLFSLEKLLCSPDVFRYWNKYNTNTLHCNHYICLVFNVILTHYILIYSIILYNSKAYCFLIYFIKHN